MSQPRCPSKAADDNRPPVLPSKKSAYQHRESPPLSPRKPRETALVLRRYYCQYLLSIRGPADSLHYNLDTPKISLDLEHHLSILSHGNVTTRATITAVLLLYARRHYCGNAISQGSECTLLYCMGIAAYSANNQNGNATDRMQRKIANTRFAIRARQNQIDRALSGM